MRLAVMGGLAACALVLGSVAGEAEAAFFPGPSPINVTIGAGGGKDQSGVAGLNGDILLGIDEQAGNVNPQTVLNRYNTLFDPNVTLATGIGDNGRIDTGPIVGCITNCSYTASKQFGFYAVKYDGLLAFFSNGGDTDKAEFTLGDGNFEVSNLTFLTPVPAALPLLGTALAGLWGLQRSRGRKGAGAVPAAA